MTRVYVFVEGQTEETFVRDVLGPYFERQRIWLTPILAETSPGYKGGIVSYGKVKNQVTRLCRKDKNAWVTTLIDYYGLPTDFPQFAQGNVSAVQRVQHLEQALAQDISERNFLPYLALHEFEALLFCDPAQFHEWFDDERAVAVLETVKASYGNPEEINDSPQTAPSKRILAAIPAYKKTLHGPMIANEIGIDAMRDQCPHFNDWIKSIESLA
ncbi:DUF4276 family protein [Amphritea pacifica]|uniref:DUF4276 family protein n=1 Tax=Amphritea pacifica TaxID=2811233 RepID=A0ABS2W3F3_9GAMM|nr:DUF4276 family protein [Amphritea pacifica]MBN0986115.1 DUF4276 family protein [Amphritea pacifica]MBN1007520.1 DUF4276 family protein [Amphritea pacifica]